MPKVAPTVTSAILADSHKKSDRGKIDLLGTFTTLEVYATPADREFSIGFLISDLPPGATNVSLWVESSSHDARQVGEGTLESETESRAVVLAHHASVRFLETGHHRIGICTEQSLIRQKTFWVPLEVSEADWPELPSGKELEEALSNPNTVKSARAVLKCDECGTEYIFQKNLDPQIPLGDDAQPFPEGGKFECRECGKLFHLKDIEGQVTAQLASHAGEG